MQWIGIFNKGSESMIDFQPLTPQGVEEIGRLLSLENIEYQNNNYDDNYELYKNNKDENDFCPTDNMAHPFYNDNYLKLIETNSDLRKEIDYRLFLTGEIWFNGDIHSDLHELIKYIKIYLKEEF